MPNANSAAAIRLIAQSVYNGPGGQPAFGTAAGPGTVQMPVTASGVGAAPKSLYVDSLTQTINGIIAPGASLIIDLSSCTDNLNFPASWTMLVMLYLEHVSGSTASGIDMDGTTVNSVPGCRTSLLLPGNKCLPYLADVSPGKPCNAPNSRLVIVNQDAVNPATIKLLAYGQ